MNNKETTNYLSLQEATQYCQYSQEYLSLRARQGKLRAIKLGRNWVTKKEWLEEYLTKIEGVKEEHLPLQEATQYCQYSQEYLSLRARQGKLRAIKLGRNWVTKKEWLQDYLAKVEEYNNLKAERIKELRKVKREGGPPENLPIGELEFVPVRVIPKRIFPVFRLSLAVGLILIIVVAGVISFSHQPFKSFAMMFGTVRFADVFKETFEVLEEYGRWLGKQIVALLWRKPERIVKEEKIIPKPGPREGMIVIPSTEEDELIKEKIKMAFSDEVKVKPKDKASGIIIPIFRTGEGEEYLYVMVPVKEEN